MPIVMQRGSAYTYNVSSSLFPLLDSNWTGTFDIFTDNMTIKVKTFQMVRGTSSMSVAIDSLSTLSLNSGLYVAVATFVNSDTFLTISSLDYITVVDAVVSDQPMTTLTMTIAKIDGTPTGVGIQTLQNTPDGAVLVSGWRGVQVKATINTAFNIGTDIIGTETVTTETNAAGYAQLAVIKGSTVTVSCPSFGKTVTVDTTGLDTIDLSEFF